jgi:hypothetical protein
MGVMGRKGGSVTSTASYYGFIYTIFGLGSSHMGLWAGPEEKACLARHMGSSLRPNNCDHCLEDKRIPEGQDKEAWYFLRSPAFESLIVLLLLLRTNSKDGETCWGPGSDAADL